MPNNKAAGFELFNPKQLNTALAQGYGSSPSSVGSSSSPVFPVNPRPANAVETGGRKKTMRAKKTKKAKKHTRRR